MSLQNNLKLLKLQRGRSLWTTPRRSLTCWLQDAHKQDPADVPEIRPSQNLVGNSQKKSQQEKEAHVANCSDPPPPPSPWALFLTSFLLRFS